MSQKLALTLTTVMSLGVAVPVAAEGLALGGRVTMVSQTVNQASVADGNPVTNRIDITAELPVAMTSRAEGKLFAHIRAGNGAPA